MELRFLVISDMHLGENTSLLTFPQGRKHLKDILVAKFGNEKIDELILVGDAVDTSLASLSQVITHASIFIHTLRSSLDIDKVIYIPGNHDHTLWTDYINKRYGENSDHHLTHPVGELIVNNTAINCDINDNNCLRACEDLLTIFFEYDYGPAWTKIQIDEDAGKNFKFVIANPIYAVEEFGRTYVFTHGTHFKSVVTSPSWMKRLIDWTQLDRLIVKIEIDSNCNVSKADNLKELEEMVARFVDSLWISAKNKPISRSDQLWYLYTILSSHFAEHRTAPDRSDLYRHQNLPSGGINHINPENKSIKDMKDYFLQHLLTYLRTNNISTNNLTFVYGDTHDGGFGEFPINGTNIRIYNTGSWVVRHKDDHPPCHVFAVDKNGQEYMLDVSFKNLKILGEDIITLAAADFENRYRATGWFVRWLLERFG